MDHGSSLRPSKPHPFLIEPSLFILNLPDHVTGKHIKELFRPYEAVCIVINKNSGAHLERGGPADTSLAQIEFASLAQAEKALVVLQHCPIPDVSPPVLLDLSTTSSCAIPSPAPSVHPRWVRNLPSGYTDSQLYDLLRPFGPIASAQVDGEFGGVVQFWSEQDACDAEDNVGVVDDQKISLEACTPNNPFFTNFDFSMDTNALRAKFSEFDCVLRSACSNGLSRGFGFIFFRTPEAPAAKKVTNDVDAEDNTMAVEFHEPELSLQSAIHPSDTHPESDLEPTPESELVTSNPTVDDEETADTALNSEVETKPPPITDSMTETENSDLDEPADLVSEEVTLTEEDNLWDQVAEIAPIGGDAKRWQAEAVRLLAEVTKLREEAIEQEKSITALRMRSAENEEEKELLTAQFQTEQQEKEEAVGQQEAMRAEIDDLKQKLAVSESHRETMKLEADWSLWEAIRKHQETQEADKAEARQKQREYEEAVELLKGEKEATCAEVEELKQKLTVSESRWETMKLEAGWSLWDAVRKQQDIQEAASAEEHRHQQEKDDVVESLKAEQEALRAENEKEKQSLKNQLQAERKEREKALGSLKAEKKALRAEVGELKQKLAASKTHQEPTKVEVHWSVFEAAKKQHEIPDATRANAEAQRKQREMEEVAESLRAELEAIRAQVDQMNSKLAASESRRNTMDLETDLPLWEAARKQLETKAKEDAAKAEERQKQAERVESQRKMRQFMAQEAARKRAEEEEAKRRAMKEEARKAREEAEKKARLEEERKRKEKERLVELRRIEQWKLAAEREQTRCVQRDRKLWGNATWTNEKALERYTLLSEEFEKFKFSELRPLTFEGIPWPVLESPLDLKVKHLQWSMVEGFFAFVRVQAGWTTAEYKNLVEKTHRMFHPDKWRSRGLLTTVPDEDLRKALDNAGNLVAQALTPLWRKTRGYD